MFENTQRAIAELNNALFNDVNQAVTLAKTTVVPAVTLIFGRITETAKNTADKANSTVPPVAPVSEPVSDPLPTPEQNMAIKGLRAVGKTDEYIAKELGVSIRTVKMAV